MKRQCIDLLYRARAIYFIDNDGVKEALVKGSTNSDACKKILRECLIQDSQSHAMSWYSRVSSPSNISDGPSRLDFSEVLSTFDVEFIQPKLDYSSWGEIG